ncbi:MAG: hypothetical protein P4L41_18775 [Flavipsychrobacter sp.]|nr:hypothetical protein [Flavipsychrobacter sp.]
MRLIATILCIYFAGLIVQPVLHAMQPVQGKTMSCCAKHNGKSSHCPMQSHNKKGCCDNGNCNPLCSQCLLCGFSAITQTFYSLTPKPTVLYKEQHFVRDWYIKGSYSCKLLRPPQLV